MSKKSETESSSGSRIESVTAAEKLPTGHAPVAALDLTTHNPATYGRWCKNANPQLIDQPKEPMPDLELLATPLDRLPDLVAKGRITADEMDTEILRRAEVQLAEALANPPVPVATPEEVENHYARLDGTELTEEDRRIMADAEEQEQINADTKARFGTDDTDRSICDVQPAEPPEVRNHFGVRRVIEGVLESADGDGVMLTIGGKLTAMSRVPAINLAANIIIALTTEYEDAHRQTMSYLEAHLAEVEKLHAELTGQLPSSHEDLT